MKTKISRYSLEYRQIQMRKRSAEGTVYFIQAETGGPVKIGFTSKEDVSERLDQLQVGNPHTLRVIAVIVCRRAYQLEQALHRRFKHLRLTGEWFNDARELRDYLKENRRIRRFSEKRVFETISPAGNSL